MAWNYLIEAEKTKKNFQKFSINSHTLCQVEAVEFEKNSTTNRTISTNFLFFFCQFFCRLVSCFLELIQLLCMLLFSWGIAAVCSTMLMLHIEMVKFFFLVFLNSFAHTLKIMQEKSYADRRIRTFAQCACARNMFEI